MIRFCLNVFGLTVLRFKLFWMLGPINVYRVIIYRLGLRTGLHPVLQVQALPPQGPYFATNENQSQIDVSVTKLDDWDLFGWLKIPLNGEPPNWFQNVYTKNSVPNAHLPWWKIPDFSQQVGDIKAVWEPSRFDWVVLLASRVASGENSALTTLNHWLKDWVSANPPYQGINWKCGQEASIRVIHLVFAAFILGQVTSPLPGLTDLICVHLKRIRPTLSYALGQSNNHGTSEAAALFIGGSWLHGIKRDNQSVQWATKGRSVLEERVRTLIAIDGSFSQYSVNYHRLALSTLCAVETWRRHLRLSPFSQQFFLLAGRATFWLYQFVDKKTGDTPNLGANDGARLLPLSGTSFRDYRPEVVWASTLFLGRLAYPENEESRVLIRLFGLETPKKELDSPDSQQFDSGGYFVLRRGCITCYLHYARYQFRPRHADVLHLDLWSDGTNWLRDAGSYSYNTKAFWEAYFPSTAAHNTVEFDGRDQMPRIGRFLRGAWLSSRCVTPIKENGNAVFAGAGYRDWKGAYHHREVRTQADKIQVTDNVGGFNKRAILRWRLRPGEWQWDGDALACNNCVIRVSADVPIEKRIVEGWESGHYLRKSTLPVLEVETSKPGSLYTEIVFHNKLNPEAESGLVPD